MAARKTIKKEQAIGKVQIHNKDSVPMPPIETVVAEFLRDSTDKPMANVGLKLGKTINLGDFESLRIDVSLFMPSETDTKSLNKTFKKCLKWCDNKMEEIIN